MKLALQMIVIYVTLFCCIRTVMHSQQHSIVKRSVMKYTICSDMKNNKDPEIRVMLTFPDILYIISQQWQVYTINQSLDDIQKYGINLMNITPVDIEKQWSAFANNLRFNEIRNKSNLLIYSTPMNISDDSFIINVPNERGLNYNLPENTLEDGLFYNVTNVNKVRAPIMGDQFFTIDYEKNGAINLTFWDFFKSNNTNDVFNYTERYSSPMYYSKKQNKVTLNSTHSEDFENLTSIEWPILSGLLKQQFFILFSSKHIHNFSYSLINSANEIGVSTLNFSSLFICQKPTTITNPSKNLTPTIPNSSSTTESSSSMIMIIILCVVLALVILTTVGVITYLTSRKAKKRLKHNKHNKHGRKQSANRQSDQNQNPSSVQQNSSLQK